MDDDATIIRGQEAGLAGDEGVLSPGAKLGDYRIVRLLGRGGMGEVYEAEHAWLAQRYALKVLPRELAGQPGFRRRFEMEARVLAAMRHEHIVSIHNAGESGGCFFLVMDLLPRSLEAELRPGSDAGGAVAGDAGTGKVRALPPPRVREIVLQVLDALEFAHAKGIIHRDLKPANILTDANGSVRLADFGVARVVGDAFVRSMVERTLARSVVSDAATRVATSASGGGSGLRDSALVGTVDFMAPEVRSGREGDGRADIYALGVIAYELLTGRRPLGMAKPPSRLVEGLDRGWDAVIERALEVELADRWPDAASMREAVEKLGRAAEVGAATVPAESMSLGQASPTAPENRPQPVLGVPPPLPPWVPMAAEGPSVAEIGRPAVRQKAVWPWVLLGIVLCVLTIGVGGSMFYWSAIRRAGEAEEMYRLEQARLEQERRDQNAPSNQDGGKDSQPVYDDPSATESSGPQEGVFWTVPDLGLEMMWVPAGQFVMGSPETEDGRDNDEGPQTLVEISSGFWLGAYEVTQAEWQKLMGYNPATFESLGPTAPVESVSWNDAVDYCRRLTEWERDNGRLPEGYVYTLPTEAQWEYACRAGSVGPYAWGDTYYPGWSNSENDEGSSEDKNVEVFRAWEYPIDSTMSVGRFSSNGWGFYDMHGNVGEWCLDWYGETLPGDSVTDPTGPEEGAQRIYRGGSWRDASRVCRSAYRSTGEADFRSNYVGFRVALCRQSGN